MGAQCTQQTTIQVFLKQKWVHLIVLYAKHIVYPSVLRMNTAVFLCKPMDILNTWIQINHKRHFHVKH